MELSFCLFVFLVHFNIILIKCLKSLNSSVCLSPPENTNLLTVTHDLVPVSDNNQDAGAAQQEGPKALLILSVLFTYIYLYGDIGGPRGEVEGSERSSGANYQKYVMRTLRELNAPQV